MSTLTVCPYCGEGMRFDGMKQHLVTCEGRSPLSAARSSGSRGTSSPSPAKAKPVSGLEFYNHLNRLSQLTRARSSGGGGGGRTSSSSRSGAASSGLGRGGLGAASPSQQDAATVRELMYPSTSLTIDFAPSHSPTSASSSSSLLMAGHEKMIAGEEQDQQEQQHSQERLSASHQWPVSDGRASVSPLVPPPPPAVRVRLDASDRPSRSQESAGAAAAAGAAAETQRSRSQGGAKTAGVSVRSRSRSDKASSGRAASAAAVARRSTGAYGERAAPVAPLLQELQSAGDADAGSGQGASDGSAAGAAARAEGEARWRAGPSAESTRSSASNTSGPRPIPQRSSFAIRLRGSSGPSPPNQPEDTSGYGAAGRLMPGAHGGGGGASPHELEASVRQLRNSLRSVQQLVDRQQEQYNALLHAHADVSRQVAAQQHAQASVMRRSLDQATAVEAALQRHTCQWRSEEAALNDSVAALWASVSDIQQQIPRSVEAAPALDYPARGAHQHLGASTLSSAPPETSASAVLKRAESGSKEARPFTVSAAPIDTEMQAHAAVQERQGIAATAAPPIRVQRAVTGEESTYYSDIGSFLHVDGPTSPRPPPSSFTFQPTVPAAVASAAASHEVRSASRGIFAHMPYTAAPVVTPPQLSRRGGDAGAAHATAARRPTTLPRSTPFVTDVLQQQRHDRHHHPHQQQQQSSRASMEDRVIAMLNAKPTVVVPHSPWK